MAAGTLEKTPDAARAPSELSSGFFVGYREHVVNTGRARYTERESIRPETRLPTPPSDPPTKSSYVVVGTKTTWKPEPWISVVGKQPVRGVRSENGLCSYNNIELPAFPRGVSAKLGEYDTKTCDGVIYFVIFPKEETPPIQADTATFRFPDPT